MSISVEFSATMWMSFPFLSYTRFVSYRFRSVSFCLGAWWWWSKEETRGKGEVRFGRCDRRWWHGRLRHCRKREVGRNRNRAGDDDFI